MTGVALEQLLEQAFIFGGALAAGFGYAFASAKRGKRRLPRWLRGLSFCAWLAAMVAAPLLEWRTGHRFELALGAFLAPFMVAMDAQTGESRRAKTGDPVQYRFRDLPWWRGVVARLRARRADSASAGPATPESPRETALAAVRGLVWWAANSPSILAAGFLVTMIAPGLTPWHRVHPRDATILIASSGTYALFVAVLSWRLMSLPRRAANQLRGCADFAAAAALLQIYRRCGPAAKQAAASSLAQVLPALSDQDARRLVALSASDLDAATQTFRGTTDRASSIQLASALIGLMERIGDRRFASNLGTLGLHAPTNELRLRARAAARAAAARPQPAQAEVELLRAGEAAVDPNAAVLLQPASGAPGQVESQEYVRAGMTPR